MLELDDLYRQEFVLFSWYVSGKLTREEYLNSMKPLDQAISDLEMANLQGKHVLGKASLQHFQKPEH